MSYSSEVLADAPLAYYRLGEASGTAMVDSSGNARNGTYSGVLLGAAGLLVGDPDTAADFNGTTSGASYSPPNSALTPPRITAECWFQADVITGDRHLVGVRSAGGATFESWALDITTQKLRFFIVTASTYRVYQSTATLSPGVNYHVAATYDGANVRLYINGALDSTQAHTFDPNVSTANLLIGQNGFSPAAWFDGRIDEVAVYGTALSAARISAHYAAGTTNAVSATGSGVASASTAPALTAAATGSGVATATLGGGVAAAATGSGVATANVVGGIWRDAAATGAGTATATAAAMPVTARNRVGGRARIGVGVVEYTPPIVNPPANTTPAYVKEVAQAFGPVTMRGTQPTFTVTTASRDADRLRIIVGGKDVTYFRDVPTPDPDYSLISPLLYGSGSITFPQIAATMEQPGAGRLRWCRKGAPVVIQRVRNGAVVATDYRGIIVDHTIKGADFTVQLGGEASGRATLTNRQVPLYRQRLDIGKWLYFAIGPSGLGRPFRPYLGMDTGIKLTARGGTSMLDYINELVAMAVKRNGDMLTVTPDTAGKYRAQWKDRATVHATAYFDDARLVPDLRSDIAEEPNRVYVTGITPGGRRVRFGHYPGLIQGPPARYPYNNTATVFGAGTTDAATDTGGGVTALVWRLRIVGLLDGEDAPGGYDADVTEAVKALQEQTGLTVTGNVNLATWRALYDLDATGYSMTGSAIYPAAQASSVREFHYNPTGSVTRRNPNYRPDKPKVDLNVDMGPGFTRQQMRDWARNERQEALTTNWVGTLDVAPGMALITGRHTPGAPLAVADMKSPRDLQPGMNLWAPQFMGGTLFHICGAEVHADGSIQFTLDTRARDTMKVWQVITRNRETRKSPARAWMDTYRSSTITKDAVVEFDEVGGKIDQTPLAGGSWTVFPVVAGQEGTIARLRVKVQTPAQEFACAVFGRQVTAKRLNHLIPTPLAKTRNDKDGTGKPWYEKDTVVNALKGREWLYAAGTNDEPCGLGPARKLDKAGNPTGAAVTGVHNDEAGFAYRTTAEPVLYVAVWVANPGSQVAAGRVMWPQLEAGA